MKINLPAEPIDGYKIKFYTLTGSYPAIYTAEATYHVDRSWGQAIGRDESGARLEHEWLVLGVDNNYFNTRLDGWQSIVKHLDRSYTFATLREAKLALVDDLQRQVQSLEDDIFTRKQYIERTLRSLEQE